MKEEELFKYMMDQYLHISDGVDDCAGWDEEAMKECAKELADKSEAEISDLRKQLSAAMALLKEYSQHSPGCTYPLNNKTRCRCGFLEVQNSWPSDSSSRSSTKEEPKE